jgi:hypothetical protein
LDAEKWVSVGEQLYQLGESNLYRSPTVDSFLSSTRKTIILSGKGMGKTHLLRQKRQVLDQKGGALFIPENTAIDLDRVRRFPANLPSATWSSITEDEWCALWEIAIACSVLLNYPLDLDDFDTHSRLVDLIEAQVLPKWIQEIFVDKLNGGRVRAAVPSATINDLLQMDVRHRKSLLKVSNNLIVQFYRNYIHSAVYVLLDAVDHALGEAAPGNSELWVRGQIGLARAAYDIQSNNNHIKVFASVREEAWASFNNENKASIEAYCVHLGYSREEMRRMVSVLCSYYHGTDDLSAILPTTTRNVVRNRGVERRGSHEERLFDYIFRHSIGTPRSLIQIINSIVYNCDTVLAPSEYERTLREQANLTSGYLAETKIRSEMAQFLDALSDDVERREFFSRVDRNVLTISDLERITRTVYGDDHAHPFCELFNIGLLGCLRRNADGRVIQYFRSPNDFDWRAHNVLPESELYLLHPALEALLSRNYRLKVEPHVVVASGDEWRMGWTTQIERGTLKIFLSYATLDAELKLAVEAAIGEYLSSAGIRHVIWSAPNDVRAGEVIEDEINVAIEAANAMVSVVTKNYLVSKWCMAELRAMNALRFDAGRTKRIALPFIFDGASRNDLGRLHQGTFIPEIEQDDAASMAKIGQALQRFWTDT